jgi:hypothetical protein
MSAHKENRNGAQSVKIQANHSGNHFIFRALPRSNVGTLQQSVILSLPSHTCHRPRNEAPSLNCLLIMPRTSVVGPAATISIEFH